MPASDDLGLVSDFDQLGASLQHLAVVLAAYRVSLLAQGFTDVQAFALCRDYQEMFIEIAVRRER